MKTVAIIQARMGSKRLPGKVLLPLAGKTVLETVIHRVRQAKKLDGILVATSDLERDDPIVECCQKVDVQVFRGSEEDVLSRYYHAAKEVKADVIIRVTADCPLVDPNTIDELVNVFKDNEYDYVLKDKMPVGTTAEIFSFKALEQAFHNVDDKYHREHVVTAFLEQSDQFFSHVYPSVGVMHQPHVRLTLDTRDDYNLLTNIYNFFIKEGPAVDLHLVLQYLHNHSELLDLNTVKNKT